jgi:hypothetical protein
MLKLRAWSKEKNKMLYQSEHSLVDFMKRLEGWGEVEFQPFIGLSDGEKKEVYEGDILIDARGEILIISPELEWNCGCCGGVWGYGYFSFPKWNESAKVIGNIYENPDLVPVVA